MGISKTTKPSLSGEGFEGVFSLHDAGGGDTNGGIVARRAKTGKRRYTTTTVGGRRRDQRKSQWLVDYEGKHKRPTHYIVRLAQPEHEGAWLLVYVDGEPAWRPLCQVSDGSELHECAARCARRRASTFDAGTMVGETPSSKTPDRTMTATLCAAVPGVCGRHDGVSDAPPRSRYADGGALKHKSGRPPE